MEMKYALLQDRTTKMYYIGYVPAIKSRENLKVIKKYHNEQAAADDLVAYSLGEKGEGSKLTLKELVPQEDKLPGGKADNLKPEDFNQDQLMKGIHHEMEHTNDIMTAMEIAMDHLISDENYYDKLDKLEK